MSATCHTVDCAREDRHYVSSGIRKMLRSIESIQVYYSGSESESSITAEFASGLLNVTYASCPQHARTRTQSHTSRPRRRSSLSPQLRSLPHPSRSSSDALRIPSLLFFLIAIMISHVTFFMSKMDVNDLARWRASFQTHRREMYGQVRSSRVRRRTGICRAVR